VHPAANGGLTGLVERAVVVAAVTFVTAENIYRFGFRKALA
jgi:hypothetical protein